MLNASADIPSVKRKSSSQSDIILFNVNSETRNSDTIELCGCMLCQTQAKATNGWIKSEHASCKRKPDKLDNWRKRRERDSVASQRISGTKHRHLLAYSTSFHHVNLRSNASGCGNFTVLLASHTKILTSSYAWAIMAYRSVLTSSHTVLPRALAP